MVPILTRNSTIICPHGGQVQLATTNVDASADGAKVLLVTDQHPVASCPFAPGGAASPCMLVRWASGATQVRVRSVAVLLQTSVGTCYNALQAPQGLAVVLQTQQVAREV